jgi:hypothetical protein
MHVTLAVSYLSIGLAEYSMGPGTSRGVRKLTRTSRVIKKKLFIKNYYETFGDNVGIT